MGDSFTTSGESADIAPGRRTRTEQQRRGEHEQDPADVTRMPDDPVRSAVADLMAAICLDPHHRGKEAVVLCSMFIRLPPLIVGILP